jgi:hypothetical protein
MRVLSTVTVKRAATPRVSIHEANGDQLWA